MAAAGRHDLRARPLTSTGRRECERVGLVGSGSGAAAALWGGVSPCELVSEATASVSYNAIVQQQLWHPCNPLCNPAASNSLQCGHRRCERGYLVESKKPG